MAADMGDDTTMMSEEPELGNPQPESLKETNPTGNNWSIVMDLESSPGSLPGFYISQGESQPRLANCSDIISRGIITLEAAQRYFDAYQTRLDHFPYRILGDVETRTLEYARSSSPLLVAAVSTVGALHLASPDYQSCCAAFLSQCASQTFSKDVSVDDIRALCIGAFWLGEVAWTLVGTAVRMATELQLHKAFFRALRGDRKAYLHARLYYLVYICDHHFSIPFGRPPLTRQCEAIRSVRRFLDLPRETTATAEEDARLVSHVLRWTVLSDAVDSFGVDVNRPLGDADLPALRRYNIAMDTLRAEWMERFAPNPHIGNYPRKGVALQYHFSKLYLCSHAFRGGAAARTAQHSADVVVELDEIANGAVRAATAILRSVNADEELQSFFDGLPVYFATMLAFSIVFLIKVSSARFGFVQARTSEIRPLIADTVAALEKVTARMHRRHLLVSMTKGMRGLVQKMKVQEGTAAPEQQQQLAAVTGIHAADPQPALQDPKLSLAADDNDVLGMFGEPSNFFMGTYDFLVDQADLSEFL
ncbi:Fungal specific transcription factor [Cordyceps fumosorosea ARSEF 2679]|uniref:Fungal specific transcription factor n=1 Tax=Cordyceps fumosorosea (strain ARSEF 2679) TaxID=1081104 RepID=A0A167R2J4_CORFA|nr:Fungal specific transcription factor [Cordyceps fumosorosea ARSEF 2679]OAA58214.1 Fungal specific transcription factor [Cordyceps fumosorosea ARSEF 2679]